MASKPHNRTHSRPIAPDPMHLATPAPQKLEQLHVITPNRSVHSFWTALSILFCLIVYHWVRPRE